MNVNPDYTNLRPATDRQLTQPMTSEEDLRELAEEIVMHCPSLTQLLLAVGSKKSSNPIQGLN